ncbi:MAG TPA: UDP-4-amino-4,6-dideoxy-N-acetyl-beta-L-altrosamine transaminase [Sphingomonadales bacterium]
MIPYGRQNISEEDISAVVEVLRSDFLTQGPAVPRFEAAVAEYVGARHAVACSNATAALHMACMALGVGPGDIVWTSPNTFVASANCALYCGASVDFVDIDPVTWNMSPAALEEKLRAAEREGRLPKVVIPVHFSGEPCDMAAIGALAKRYGFRVIEDAAHAIGAAYPGGKVGDCRHSDIVVFSFHPVKIITTGEGGLALTNDPEIASRLNLARSHGITRDPELMQGEPHGPWYYEQIGLGFNYRITDMQAALGLSQMARLEEFLDRRHQLADAYDAALAGLPLTTPYRNPASRSALHLYVVRLGLDRIAKGHRQVFEELRASGIGVNLHYLPVYLQPHYRSLGFAPGHCPEAERYYAEAISLPIFATLSDTDQRFVIDKLGEVIG